MWSNPAVLVVCLLVVVAIWFAVNHPELIPLEWPHIDPEVECLALT